MKVFSTDIHEKKMFIHDVQAMVLQSDQVSEYQNIFLWCPSWGYLTEIVEIQYTPNNSNLQGIKKIVQVIECLSY